MKYRAVTAKVTSLPRSCVGQGAGEAEVTGCYDRIKLSGSGVGPDEEGEKKPVVCGLPAFLSGSCFYLITQHNSHEESSNCP